MCESLICALDHKKKKHSTQITNSKCPCQLTCEALVFVYMLCVIRNIKPCNIWGSDESGFKKIMIQLIECKLASLILLTIPKMDL